MNDKILDSNFKQDAVFSSHYLLGFGIFAYLSIQSFKYTFTDIFKTIILLNTDLFISVFWIALSVELIILMIGLSLISKTLSSTDANFKNSFFYSFTILIVLNIIQFLYFSYKYDYSLEVLDNNKNYLDAVSEEFPFYANFIYLLEYLIVAAYLFYKRI